MKHHLQQSGFRIIFTKLFCGYLLKHWIKNEAIKQYTNEINDYPHPRSLESVKNRAGYWGSKIGKDYAESFVFSEELIDEVNVSPF